MTALEETALEEASIDAGLHRFVYRLEVIGSFFDDSRREGEVLTRILFENPQNKLATEVLLKNLCKARKLALLEMQDQGQIELPHNVDQLARILSSVTWGTVLFHYRGELPTKRMKKELVRASLTTVLPYATTDEIKNQMTRIINSK